MSGFPGLVFAELEGKLVVRNQPVPERTQLDNDTLRNLLGQAGYGSWFLLDAALATLVARGNALNTGFEVVVGERRDGSFKLEIAKDAMCAWVTLTPPYAGKAVTPDDIVKALGDAGVVFGIDEPALKQACEMVASGRVVAERIVAAASVPPLKGEDTRFEILIELTRDRAPKMNEDGLIDFREIGDIPMVEAGDALMRRIPPTSGVDGHNIRGAVMPASPGRDHPFADKLAGVCLADDDANLLRAAVKGQPVRVGNGVSVEQVVTVKSVSLASGNISFDGSVQVDGDVMSGMKVHATGDITVAGIVEGGELDAGGNIQVGGGIIARAKVRADGSVSARFVENSRINAGTIIAVDDMALDCELQAGNQIMVGIKSPQRGRLVGGSTRAMMLVSAPVLGAATSGVTKVLVGVNPELEARYQEMLQLVEKQQGDEENLKKLVQHLTRNGDKNGMLDRARASWQQAVQLWAQSLQEKDALEKQLAMTEGAKVEVSVGVAGAIDLAFGKKLRRVRNNYDAGVFSVNTEDQHVFVDRQGNVTIIN